MTTARSRYATTDRRYYGVAEAIVEEVDDPARENRVRVRFPWFDESEVSDWCRMANAFAGNGYGSTWSPEKGDEVLVAFVHGDMRLPVVVGGLYNGSDKPATPRTADKNQKAWRTRAGHQVTLDDSSASLGVDVVTSAGHRLHLDDIANEITLAISGGPSIVLSQSGGTLAIKATSISLEATTITLNASATLDAKGKPIKLNSP
ncbi:MAG: hypothetical protein AUI14_21500 [Actinobacteria bacterium 13_2_20CM_2_71_6]|nr:MAG: hypothetical protein AUI14_21500 [Actinobacteria bacterium 13_2_20CM_2_71_6]